MATRTLSESESKALLADYGVPMAGERLAATPDDAVAAADELGYPVVAKLNGDAIAHKTERGLVRLGLADAAAVRRAADELLAAATADDGDVVVLVAPMIRGNRELIAGVLRDPQFGPTVMLGAGRHPRRGRRRRRVPPGAGRRRHRPRDDRPAGHAAPAGRVPRRGPGRPGGAGRDPRRARSRRRRSARRRERRRQPADRRRPTVRPIAVDALVELGDATDGGTSAGRPTPSPEQFQALFEPRGVLVAGASSHPGKFGFVAMHNLLASGYEGGVYGTNLQGEEVLGIQTVADVADLPDDSIDLVIVCTPASANLALLRACAAKGVRAAFVTSAGYGEAGEAGKVAEDELVALCDELGILLAGPNGQGVAQHAGQAVRADRGAVPAGRADRRGQPERQLRVQLPQLRPGHRRRHQPGRVGRATRRPCPSPTTSTTTPTIRRPPSGWPTSRASPTAAACSTAWPPRPPASRSCSSRAGPPRAAPAPRPATPAPWPPTTRCSTASAGPPGSPAPPRSRRRSRRRRRSPPSPPPTGPNVVVLTTAGGWGVVTADAIARDGDLRLLALPDDLRDAIDGLLPPRWSRNNPVDCAGGETRDTIPEVMRLIAEHPDVHAIVYLGLGIQSNQARMMRAGRFFPGYGLDRIVGYHERQDARFAEAADELSRGHRQADPHRHRAGRRRSGQRRSGRRAGQRTAVLPERQPRRHRARPPLPGRPPPEPSPAVSPARRPAVNPIVVLSVLALIPAAILFGVWRWASGQADGAESPPPTSAPVAPPAAVAGPRPRRCCRSVGRPACWRATSASRRSRARSPAFGATLAAPSCVVGRRRRDPRRLAPAPTSR